MIESDRQFSDALNAALVRMVGREPRWRYFQVRNGPMFFWTTEKAGDGRYHSGVYRPVGRGSRSGKATAWRMDEAAYSRHTLRADAKARALRLFTEWKTTD